MEKRERQRSDEATSKGLLLCFLVKKNTQWFLFEILGCSQGLTHQSYGIQDVFVKAYWSDKITVGIE